MTIPGGTCTIPYSYNFLRARRTGLHPHLAREATVRDVETTRYGRDYARCRGKITHVDKDPQTGAATGYIVCMEDGGNEVRFESVEIRILEALD
jgi:hypothetical protein